MKDQGGDDDEQLVLTLGGERSPEVYAFSATSLAEKQITGISVPRKACASVFYNDSLIVCGGKSYDTRDRSDLSTCLQYGDSHEQTKSVLIPSLPHPLQYFQMVNYRNQALVIGGTWSTGKIKNGKAERTRSNLVYRLENGGKGWRPYNQLATARSSHACTVIKPDHWFLVDLRQQPRQDLYCFGGKVGEERERTDSMEVLFDGEDRWRRGVPMTMARSAFAAASYRSKIYVTGGKNHRSDVEDTVDIYDVRDRKWRLFAPKMSMRRYYHSAVYLDGHLFLRGGTNMQDSENARKSIEFISIDPFTGTPGTEFLDFHKTYDGKMLHQSVLVPKKFVERLLNDDGPGSTKDVAQMVPQVKEQWEEEEITAISNGDIIYGQVETKSEIGAFINKFHKQSHTKSGKRTGLPEPGFGSFDMDAVEAWSDSLPENTTSPTDPTAMGMLEFSTTGPNQTVSGAFANQHTVHTVFIILFSYVILIGLS